MGDPIDLGAALETVVAAIAAEFGTFKAVEAEDEKRKGLPVPAILVQISELEPDPDMDPHTGQFPCLVHLEARIVMGHRTPRVRREVVKAAGALAAFLHNSRLGVAWGAAKVIAVDPDDFAPLAETFDIWRVEWVHSADIGESYFVDEGVTPHQVLASWSPDIGPDNEPEYEEIEGDV
ncbi:hypothetical protein [uncultured Tateyamaria sp.]|uniref:hypothetical protein n=1 Tax=uncultured Tateyamaria sp. TaxID=455651 RepID=UPI0026122F06|nr:hypothetical protein [uncultured Tateyamaria sp.]